MAELACAGLASATDLTPLPVWERHGFVYVATTSDVHDTSAMDDLSLFAADFAALNLSSYTLFRESVSVLPMNWKFPVDSFLETYHIPTLHRRSVAPTQLITPLLFDARGRNARMCQWRRNAPDTPSEFATDEQFRQYGNLIFYLFPNVIVNFPVASGCLKFWHMMPDGPDRVRVTTHFYAGRAVEFYTLTSRSFEISNGIVYQRGPSPAYGGAVVDDRGGGETCALRAKRTGAGHFHDLLAQQHLGTAHG